MPKLDSLKILEAQLVSIFRLLGSKYRASFYETRFKDLHDGNVRLGASRISCVPGLYQINELNRVTACGFGRTLESELEKLNATSFPESEMTQQLVRDALVVGGLVLGSQTSFYLSDSQIRKALGSPLMSFNQAALANSAQGLKYFGHWLRDDCAMYEHIRNESPLLSIVRPPWPDRYAYEAAFNQTWTETSFARVSELKLYRELGFSRDKARRLNQLRTKLRSLYTGRNVGKVVYVTRGELGEARQISNADEVESAFVAAGIQIITPAVAGKNLFEELLDAEVIITIEGSQASHAVYSLADRGALLILQPPDRFYNPHHEWARLLGMRYGITIGQKEKNGFRIDPSEVFSMLDRLSAAPRHIDI